MLSEHEQRALAEIEQSFGTEAGGPVPRPPGDTGPTTRDAGHPVARRVAAVGLGVALLLLVVGVPAAAGAVATATCLVWLLWRYWDLLSDKGTAVPPAPAAHRRSAAAARRRRVVDHLLRVAEAQR